MISRKFILPAITLLLAVLIFCILLYLRNKTVRPAALGAAHFRSLDGKTLENGGTPNGKGSLVICIDPDCQACQSEIKGLSTDTTELCRVNVVIVAESASKNAMQFFKALPANISRHAQLVSDTSGKAALYFGRHVLPVTYLFDRGGVVVRSWQGEVSVSGLRNAMVELNSKLR